MNNSIQTKQKHPINYWVTLDIKRKSWGRFKGFKEGKCTQCKSRPGNIYYKQVKSQQTNKTWKIFRKGNCKTEYAIYFVDLDCTICNLQYVNKNKTTLKIRLINQRKELKELKRAICCAIFFWDQLRHSHKAVTSKQSWSSHVEENSRKASSSLKISLMPRKSVEFTTWKIALKKATAGKYWQNLSFLFFY